jgi:hypothetical protein
MRRVPLLAMLAVLLGLCSVPAHAVPAEGILLRSGHTAYVDLYVYVNRTISIADVTMKTQGSYVGFYMSPAPADRDTVGALVMPRVGATGQDTASIMKLGESWDVRAGRYRVYVITDGLSEIFIPIEGQGFRGWVPRGRAPLSVRPADFDIPAGSTTGAVDVHLPIRQRSLIVAAGLASSASLTAVDEISTCIAESPECAQSYASDAAARVPLARAWMHGAALRPPGGYDAVLELDRLAPGADAASHIDGVVMVLTIGRQT